LVLGKLLHGVATLSDAALNDRAIVPEAGGGQAEFEPGFREVAAAQVAEFDPLQI
jgi:hypothetical protein